MNKNQKIINNTMYPSKIANHIVKEQAKEIKLLKNIINETIEYLEPIVEIDECIINGRIIKPALDKLKEIKKEKGKIIKDIHGDNVFIDYE